MNVSNIGQRQALEPMPLVPERERKPCRDCGQEFEDDGWAICKACRKKIFEPSTQETEPEKREAFRLGFPQYCPQTGTIWHQVWTDGGCERCEHYHHTNGWGHGCQHPERDDGTVISDPDNEFETEAALIVNEDTVEPEPVIVDNEYEVSPAGWFRRWIAGDWVVVAKGRSGFPQICPTGHADPVNLANCQRCPHHTYCAVQSGYCCAHKDYQQAPGDHFCRYCGHELSPYAQAHGWAYCNEGHCDRRYKDQTDEPEAKTFEINVVGPLTVIPTRESEPEPEPEPSKLAVHFSSETPEHYTPQVVVDATVTCMGEIDLDPCSNSSEQPNVPAKAHFTKEDDGLLQPWDGRVYMNPPYGRDIALWVEKLCEEYRAGRTSEAIALVPSRTDTQWWQNLRDFPVCFVTGRLTFVGNDDPAPFPSAVFYLGENIGAFYRAFCELGDCWQRMEPGISFGE